MADFTYTKLFEQIYKRAEEQFFEEVYNSSKSKEYDSYQVNPSPVFSYKKHGVGIGEST